MRPIDNSSVLTPDERRAELAGILAAGVLRLHPRAALPADLGDPSASENSLECGVSCLEVPAETVLSVHNG